MYNFPLTETTHIQAGKKMKQHLQRTHCFQKNTRQIYNLIGYRIYTFNSSKPNRLKKARAFISDIGKDTSK
jgi:hypothetical protein